MKIQIFNIYNMKILLFNQYITESSIGSENIRIKHYSDIYWYLDTDNVVVQHNSQTREKQQLL